MQNRIEPNLFFTDKFVIKEQETSVEENTSAMYSTCQMSKQYMEDCVDLLAGKLLAVWQVEDEEEWLEEEPSFSQVDAGEKVMNWLQEADILDNTAEQGMQIWFFMRCKFTLKFLQWYTTLICFFTFL